MDSDFDDSGDWLYSLVPPSGIGPAQRRVLDVVATNIELAAIYDVAEVARKSGVNNSTVVRFAQTLGFAGWPHLQQELRARFLARLSTEQTLTTHPSGLPASAVHASLRNDVQNLTRSLRTVDEADVAAVVDAMSAAERVTVAAMGSAVGPATILAHLGQTMGLDYTVEGRGGIHLATAVNRMAAGDVLMVINLWRPIRDLVTVASVAREAGLVVVAITDVRRGPLAAAAHHSLIVPSEGISYVQSATAAVSVVYGLLAGVQAALPTETAEAIRRIQGTWRKIGSYLE